MADFGAIVGGINSAISIGKILRDTEKGWDVAELKIKMSDLIDKLVDAKDALQTNREENIALREEIAALKQKLAMTAEVYFENNMYWSKDAEGKAVGPYCPKCKDGDAKLSRLLKETKNAGDIYYHCRVCTNRFDDPTTQPGVYQIRSYPSSGFI